MLLIAQVLCPSRHCIIALAIENETPERTEEMIREIFEDAVGGGQLNRRCALCGSPNLSYEVNPTVFATMAEVRPELRRLQRESIETSRRLFGSDRAFGAQQAGRN